MKIKDSEPIVTIPILRARLCLDCGVVHNAPLQCPKCASSQWTYLVKFLNREESTWKR